MNKNSVKSCQISKTPKIRAVRYWRYIETKARTFQTSKILTILESSSLEHSRGTVPVIGIKSSGEKFTPNLSWNSNESVSEFNATDGSSNSESVGIVHRYPPGTRARNSEFSAKTLVPLPVECRG